MDPAAHGQDSPATGTTLTRPPPRSEHLVEAVKLLCEGIAVPPLYLAGLLDLVEEGYLMLYLLRQRRRRRAA